MTRQELFAWCMDQYGTEPEYPWKDRNAVLRHKDNKKWYGVILETGKNKLGIPGEGTAELLNVKCDPVRIRISAILLARIFVSIWSCTKI